MSKDRCPLNAHPKNCWEHASIANILHASGLSCSMGLEPVGGWVFTLFYMDRGLGLCLPANPLGTYRTSTHYCLSALFLKIDRSTNDSWSPMNYDDSCGQPEYTPFSRSTCRLAPDQCQDLLLLPGSLWAPRLPGALSQTQLTDPITPARNSHRLLATLASDWHTLDAPGRADFVAGSWQAQHFVNLEVPISRQAQHFVSKRRMAIMCTTAKKEVLYTDSCQQS